MFDSFIYGPRVIRAACTLARFDVLVPQEFAEVVPAPWRWAAKIASFIPLGPRLEPGLAEAPTGQRLAAALTGLGPAYIKLGQILATRPDVIGDVVANELKHLQDRLPPFSMEEAQQAITEALGKPAEVLFDNLSAPIAAASIAQVHKANIKPQNPDETLQEVAVKVLRPGVEAAFNRDVAAFAWAARMAERFSAEARRLEAIQLVGTLKASVDLEMDLRLEAAAASELKEKNAHRRFFRVPDVDWPRTSQRVLTSEWIDAIPLSDIKGLQAAGLDLKDLAEKVIQIFLHQALEDGFFHADMHQGNLFADKQGRLVAVDFGIMGRLDFHSRRYLAEILYGFLTRNYDRLADVHFEAGYVPEDKSREAFSQALRSVGEPIFGRPASEISMAKLLTQLFQVTEVFNMRLQPQLVLLQKTMVVVEGVARDLDPDLNIWKTSEPVAEAWMKDHFSPEAKLKEAANAALALGPVLTKLPETLRQAETITAMASKEGLRLHPDTTRALAEAKKENNKPLRTAAWVGAIALVAIALSFIW